MSTSSQAPCVDRAIEVGKALQVVVDALDGISIACDGEHANGRLKYRLNQARIKTRRLLKAIEFLEWSVND